MSTSSEQMSEGLNLSIFRGKGQSPAVIGINQVEGLDITTLVEKQEGAPGETAIVTFPVRSQVTWFRAKYLKGRIHTEIITDNDYRAVVKVAIFDEDGVELACSFSSANANDDGIYGFKLVETAESRAVKRALDWAGFGTQLEIKTYDETEASVGSPQKDDKKEEKGMPAMPKEAQISSTPDKIATGKKVDANKPAHVADISEIEGAANQKKTRTPDSKKASSDSAVAQPVTTADEQTSTANDTHLGGEQVPPAAAKDTDGVGDGGKPDAVRENETGEQVVNGSSNAGANPNTDEVNKGSKAAGAPTEGEKEAAPDNGGKQSVEEMLVDAVKQMPTTAPDAFNPVYFDTSGGPIDPNAYFKTKKDGRPAGVTNDEVQKAIVYLTSHKGYAPAVKYPTAAGNLCGLNYNEVHKMEGGQDAIAMVATSYTGKNLAALAAALIIFSNTKKKDAGK